MPTFTTLPKQTRFLQSTAREVLYSGAFGAGKSFALALKCAIRASVPGAREALVRKHLVTLKQTTLRTLLNGDGTNTPAILPPGTYHHNKSEKTIEIKGGGMIVYFGLDDPEKIGSYNLSGVGVDEAVELTEDDWTQLRGRIRMQVDGLPNQIYGSCNPGPPSHFLAERFGLALGHTPFKTCEAVQTCSADNTNLPADYLADLDTFVGLRKARYVDGKWVGSEGLVYDGWDRQQHVSERDGEWNDLYIGIDDGYRNPFAALLVGRDADDRLHVIREHYQSGLVGSRKVEVVRGLASPDEAIVVIDAAAAELAAELRDAGYHVIPGKKNNTTHSVFSGIMRVQQRLADCGDGRPGLTVGDGCVDLIKEFETYEWRDTGTKDEPIKEHDHAMDALRYVVNHVDAGANVEVLTTGGAKERSGEELSFERLREDPDWGF